MTQRYITVRRTIPTLLALATFLAGILSSEAAFAQKVPADDSGDQASGGMNQGVMLYSLNFKGGRTDRLAEVWRKAMPSDTIVMTESAQRPQLPAFEIRNARLTELARSIAFLSEGALTMEVVEGDAIMPGNIWRIGTPPTKGSGSVKMRAVGAPHLFTDDKAIDRVLSEVQAVEQMRVKLTEELGKADQATLRTSIDPLPAQKVFVLFGTEEGIAGVESLIKACEQNAAAIEAARVREQAVQRAAEDAAKGVKCGE